MLVGEVALAGQQPLGGQGALRRRNVGQELQQAVDDLAAAIAAKPLGARQWRRRGAAGVLAEA